MENTLVPYLWSHSQGTFLVTSFSKDAFLIGWGAVFDGCPIPSLMALKLPENEQTHCLFQFAFTPPAPLGLDAIVQKCRRVFVCIHFP